MPRLIRNGHIITAEGSTYAGVELNSHEAKFYSQNGEDGILLEIFNRIGARGARFVEFGVGCGLECNTAIFAFCFGWRGLLMDMNPVEVSLGKRLYYEKLRLYSHRIKLRVAKVTAENINKLLEQHDFAGDIDLLSIDIDGNDYWVWKAIEVLHPRVVVIEYNASLGTDEALSLRYNPEHVWPGGLLHGASLLALVSLGREKGYSLVCCNSDGVNAFFVLDALNKDALPVVTIEQAFYPHAYRTARMSLAEQKQKVMALDFVKVD